MQLSHMYQRPGFLLRRAHQISAAIFENACAHIGLTQAQYGALVVLASEPGIDQSSLGRALGFDKVTIMRVLRGLEERGLALRAASSTSRKHLALHLTPEGKHLLAKAERPVGEAYEQLMSAFDASQREQFIHMLAQLCESIGHEARAPLVKHRLSLQAQGDASSA